MKVQQFSILPGESMLIDKSMLVNKDIEIIFLKDQIKTLREENEKLKDQLNLNQLTMSHIRSHLEGRF